MIIIIASLLVTSVYGEQTTSVRHGSEYGNTQGGWLHQADPQGYGHGKSTHWFIMDAGGNKAERIIIRWDSLTNAVGANRIITAASCSLKVYKEFTGTGAAWTGTIEVYCSQILEDWLFTESDEWHGTDGGPTWSYNDTAYIFGETVFGVVWTNGGCSSPSSSSATIQDSVDITTDPYTWYVWDLHPDLVQAWYDSPETNYGLIFYTVETGTEWTDGYAHQRAFYAPYHATEANRPILHIESVASGSMSGVTINGVTR